MKSKAKVTKMALCEVPHIFLRTNQLYKFYAVKGCAKCQALDVYRKKKNETPS
jgi:hypothetical protein